MQAEREIAALVQHDSLVHGTMARSAAINGDAVSARVHARRAVSNVLAFERPSYFVLISSTHNNFGCVHGHARLSDAIAECNDARRSNRRAMILVSKSLRVTLN